VDPNMGPTDAASLREEFGAVWMIGRVLVMAAVIKY